MVPSRKQLVVAVVVWLAVASSQAAMGDPNNPVLWNRLGSQAQIEHSEIGLNGTFGGGSFVPGPLWWNDNPGNFAYAANYDQDLLVTFPKESVPWQSGCIEFWAKLSGFSGGIPDGQRPDFFAIEDGYRTYRVGFNGNDGCGNGGLCGTVARDGNCGTGEWSGWTYEGILGTGQVQDWHHYALVWKQGGIPGIGGGNRQLAVFLDGVLNTNHWRDLAQFAPLTSGTLGLLRNDNNHGAITIDNLKIWDYAKTDFSDRYIEPEPLTALLLMVGIGFATRARSRYILPETPAMIR